MDALFQVLDAKLDKLIEQSDGTFARRAMSIIYDGTTVAQVDRTLQCLRVMDEIHSQIHRAKMFCAGYIFEGVANDATADILVITPAGKNVHLRHSHTTEGAAYAQVFRGVTASANGTAVTPDNLNQTSAAVASSLVYHGPTITDLGTALCPHFIAAGSGGHAGGGEGLGFGETVFPPSTAILVRITNKSGQARTMGATVHFYEADP